MTDTRQTNSTEGSPAGNPPPSLDRKYFDDLYAKSGDPWHFETSPYEREKYEQTLNTLGQARYASAFEVGCSIGVLTEKLAGRCDDLLSVDTSHTALEKAKQRCQALRTVHFELMEVPGQWPDRSFDLILLSEVIYYFNRSDLAELVFRVRGSLKKGGDCVLVHWTEKTDYPLQGDEACELFLAFAKDFAAPITQKRFPSYRIDVLRKTDI